ncbi:hypothetical protein ASD23_11095 [Agromyces sp. Root1464]|uniref:hypothetical protein n=1 Tax=Agromyces sp. Root1464 TaxID=1736467 RepID=UPI0006FEC9A7|nr:hypothetical protein [Agromyces sp. Root1464]KQZ08884.1 hypothetical protein ASD23_11095 [Agromyces sp. Root1464]
MKRWAAGTAATVIGGALILSTGALGAAVETDAAWSGPEQATGSFAALTVPRPVLGPTCTLVPGLAGLTPVITVTWTVPAGSGFTSANAQYGVGDLSGLELVVGPLLGSVTTTGPVSGVYTTKFDSGLLSGLLGGTKSVAVRFVHSSGWTSAWSQANASMGLAGTNPQCTVVP